MEHCWEVGADVQPLRTEASAKCLLTNLGMQVQKSHTFGRNDCLIDSVLLSLQASGHIIASLNLQQRNMAAVQVRDTLPQVRLTDATMDAYLSHDEHLPCIFESLLEECPHLWVDIVKARLVPVHGFFFCE